MLFVAGSTTSMNTTVSNAGISLNVAGRRAKHASMHVQACLTRSSPPRRRSVAAKRSGEEPCISGFDGTLFAAATVGFRADRGTVMCDARCSGSAEADARAIKSSIDRCRVSGQTCQRVKRVTADCNLHAFAKATTSSLYNLHNQRTLADRGTSAVMGSTRPQQPQQHQHNIVIRHSRT